MKNRGKLFSPNVEKNNFFWQNIHLCLLSLKENYHLLRILGITWIDNNQFILKRIFGSSFSGWMPIAHFLPFNYLSLLILISGPVYERIYILDRIKYRVFFAWAKLTKSNNEYYLSFKRYPNSSNSAKYLNILNIFKYFVRQKWKYNINIYIQRKIFEYSFVHWTGP